jgi:hypothetical protein
VVPFYSATVENFYSALDKNRTVERLTISKAIAIAEAQAKIEAQTPSLIEADSPERLASWQSTLELLRVMKERGVPESMRDD